MAASRLKSFNIRFSQAEFDRLDRIAEHYALSAAAVVRMLLKRETDMLDAQATATRRPKAAKRAR